MRMQRATCSECSAAHNRDHRRPISLEPILNARTAYDIQQTRYQHTPHPLTPERARIARSTVAHVQSAELEDFVKEHLKSFILNLEYRKSKLPRKLYDWRQKLFVKIGWKPSSKVLMPQRRRRPLVAAWSINIARRRRRRRRADPA